MFIRKFALLAALASFTACTVEKTEPLNPGAGLTIADGTVSIDPAQVPVVTTCPTGKYLAKSASGWEKQLNLVSWNDRDPKYDLREWSPDGEKMGKGVTLSKEELLALKELLNKMEW